QDASAMRSGAISLADFLKTAVSSDVGTNGELLMARASQPNAGPTATVAVQLQAAKGSNGEYGSDIFSDALAILGLRSAGQAVAGDAVTFLKSQQKSDGGWSFDNADQFGEDSNTTTYAPSTFLLRPLAQKGFAEGKVALLPCPATSTATPTPGPTPTPGTVTLAQTGGSAGPDGRPVLAGLIFLATGLGVLRRRLRGHRR